MDYYIEVFSAKLEPGAVDMFSRTFLPFPQNFSAWKVITLAYTGCTGTCTVTIIGPGLDVECNATTISFDFPLHAAFGKAPTTFYIPEMSFDCDTNDPGLFFLHTQIRIIVALGHLKLSWRSE